jgi:hypothetical protein
MCVSGGNNAAADTVGFSGELFFSGRATMTPFLLTEKEFCLKLSEQILASLGDRLGPD